MLFNPENTDLPPCIPLLMNIAPSYSNLNRAVFSSISVLIATSLSLTGVLGLVISS